MRKAIILIVDDEEDALKVLEKRLTSQGYSVISTTDGAEAVALAKSKHPDIIILDIMMPGGMEGGQVAAELKDHPSTKNIPVIFLTALRSKAEEKEYGLIIGDNVTLAKPFDPEMLLDKIKNLLPDTAAL
ncbi:MAG: response regulator [Candidatus Omnitrophota bacterium]|jgi:DNA-binding response OmpR family regulator